MNCYFFIQILLTYQLFMCTVNSEKVKFHGYKVLRLHASNEKILNIIDQLEADPSLQLDFWTEPIINATVDVCVPPKSFQKVESTLKRAGISYQTKIDDLQSLIDEEESATEEWRAHIRLKREALNLDPGSGADDPEIDHGLSPTELDRELFYWFNVIGQYASAEEIVNWLTFAKYTRPDLVSLELVGFSYEKRPIKLVKIGVNRPDGQKKPAVWIDAGIHAREWVTTATATYIIYQLVDGYGKYEEVNRMLETYDWYILPLHNPDGYEYSRDYNRMWRKSRAPTYDYKCIGIDLNRNYGFMWQTCTEAPKAKHCIDTEKPCAAVYGGPHAFSEPETKAVSSYILKHKEQIKLFFSLHAYSQLWLIPWGYTKKLPKDVQELERVARAGSAALENIYGTKYSVGSPARILYHVGGSSLDWAKAEASIPYPFTLELRDTGQYGFLLPQSLIVPTANETYRGILSAIQSANIPQS